MNITTTAKRFIAAGIATAAASSLLASTALAAPIPSSLQVPAHNNLARTVHAVGTQTYSCSTDGAGGYAWQAQGPYAPLVDATSAQVGFLYDRFGFDPTWQANDGSEVDASPIASVTVSRTAIPWVLFKTTAVRYGATGWDFVSTTYIQQINTIGGLAPAKKLCNAATWESQVHVPFTADYNMYHAD
ncbi:MAG: hypothetical protein QOE31_2755 [Solirubrobacteraceae bacterium]|jgi:hypothetical protein|nr:hypothetical protein [Solirubrobacteraceae bacterium]